MPFPEKETKENRKKKEKDSILCLAEAVSQGFALENYARRASFSRGKRRSRLTFTGRRRQATFAVFLFLLMAIIKSDLGLILLYCCKITGVPVRIQHSIGC